MHLWKEFGDMGLLGATTPAKYGGSELSYTAHTMIMEEGQLHFHMELIVHYVLHKLPDMVQNNKK